LALFFGTCLRCLYVLHDCHAPFSLGLGLAYLSHLYSNPLFFGWGGGDIQHHPWLLAACVRALISILKRLYKIQQATQVACSLGGWRKGRVGVIQPPHHPLPILHPRHKKPPFLSEAACLCCCPCCCLVSISLSKFAHGEQISFTLSKSYC